MNKEIEIPEGYEARIEGNKVILEKKENEDERIRKDLITFICQFAPEHLKTEYVSYLEKRKEQSHWKPSEEQMAALLNAEGLVRANNYPENAKILASLYTDLKKL